MNRNPECSTPCVSGEPGVQLGQERGGRTEAGGGHLPAGAGGRVPDNKACLCRRNGKVKLSGMAIADITLLSGFHALQADLEKVW